jgi:hypothetical protein
MVLLLFTGSVIPGKTEKTFAGMLSLRDGAKTRSNNLISGCARHQWWAAVDQANIIMLPLPSAMVSREVCLLLPGTAQFSIKAL